ncbi:bifunctional folylpolyglutamate synthase/dihydrofolate synthase [Alicyclobacillus fastidiosus]|uniref:tetrahydrofolate synthase n=1 Tax=Alicyclobacillus fastidiosus TaxID=392011 RepID=A0ABV5A9E3_9BACL|nr:bifunctional folylpolyglutamate synthase/dihydrofolate synthase [Alicyclobacillus fastidiosus]WEH10819.1 bifunctional folylpolyglutamate synthase/dihydrofolate synthase [Alicyclobacillus fastidiosus]
MIEQEVTKAIEWIFESYTRVPPAKRVGFDRDVRHPEWTRWLLDAVGRPDESAYNVAVTGSKGKGAHAILLAAILQAAGLRVGLFTSPHLVDFLERLRVNGMAVSNEDFVRLAKGVRETTKEIPLPADQYLGPVGLVAVMASIWFREQKTDVNVFELGRGAMYDDVNRVRHQGALVTPIFAEHLDKLGPEWSDVVREKLGVVTEDTTWTVSYEQDAVVERMMEEYFSTRHQTWRLLGRDFTYEVVCGTGGVCSVQVTSAKGETLRASMGVNLAPFAGNVAVALTAAGQVLKSLDMGGQTLDVSLAHLAFPGRLQVISKRPTCLVDGTIHAVNARFVVDWLLRAKPSGKVTAVLSLPDDKDALGVVETLAPHVDGMVFTTCSNPHLRYTRDLVALAKEHVQSVQWEPDVEVAVQRAQASAKPEDTILFLGTQSFVGDVLRIFEVPTKSLWHAHQIAGREPHWFGN